MGCDTHSFYLTAPASLPRYRWNQQDLHSADRDTVVGRNYQALIRRRFNCSKRISIALGERQARILTGSTKGVIGKQRDDSG